MTLSSNFDNSATSTNPVTLIRRQSAAAQDKVFSSDSGFTPAASVEKDDLKRLHGIGPAMEKLLHENGVFNFRQIANWTPEEVQEMDQKLNVFNGRIERDQWVEQARSVVEKCKIAQQIEQQSEFLRIEANLNRAQALVDDALESPELELSIVMPCLNEADTLATCIIKCNKVIREHNLAAEVVIADNGSTDGSIEIAREHGARVVHVTSKGYGSALQGGINAARGKYVIMGDADDSYNFLEIPKFVEKLRAGHQLVQGCRLPSGGGQVLPGAMPFLHRWWGNPMFSAMVKTMFKAPINDVYCGMRGFTKDLYNKLDLRCTGMTFATEMIIKSSLFHKEEIAEVPITLHPDGRKAHAPHLKTFRDGWRTLRFFLVYSPKYLFQIPGILLLFLGLLAYGLALPGINLFGATLDAHTMLFGTLAILMGFQLVQFAIFSKTFAIEEGLIPQEKSLTQYSKWFTLERGLVIGSTMFVIGAGLLAFAVNEWRLANFGGLDYARTMRVVIPGITLAAIGFQTIASSFFVGVLKLGGKER